MTESNINILWIYLSASPLFGLMITLAAYSIAYQLYLYSRFNPLINPILIAVSIIISVLLMADISYDDYFSGGQFVHFLLGPATVALAIPLYQQFHNLKKLWLPILITLIVGSMTGIISSVGLASMLETSLQTQLSLAPKSVTTAVAMAISEQVGGIPSLTAVLVVITGIIGAVLGTKLFAVFGIKDDSVKGIAMGIAAHGIGTARAFQISKKMGAFSGLGMALSALVTAFILPVLINFLDFV
ncbi:MAG: LrgB family protein [gamma proteobacterium symbiont of Taylorina sp.]|nr:LrgB family protein [gamma proteobacterium symbiont of Taylorina sp.]